MKILSRKVLVLAGVMALSFNSFAEVLQYQDVKKEVLNSNFDIKVQYEKFYQAQRNVSVAYGEFLPKLNIQLLYLQTSVAVLQTVVPTPSNWFAYKSSKHLKTAEKFASNSIKLNILQELTKNFVSLKHQEMVLESMLKEEKVLEKVFNDAQANENLGFGTAKDTFSAKRGLLQHRQQILVLKSLMKSLKQALLIALNKPANTEITLGDVPELSESDLPMDISQATQVALTNSNEIVSNSYQKKAAKEMRRSQKYSFISFNGIGFDYPSLLSIESSKVKVIGLQGQQLELKIQNQVTTAYSALDILKQRIEIQKEVISATNDILNQNFQLFNGRQVPYSKVIGSTIDLLSEQRALIKLNMEKSIQVAKVKRILSLDNSFINAEVNSGSTPETSVGSDSALELKITEYKKTFTGKRPVAISLSGLNEMSQDVASVHYTVERFIKNRKVKNKSANYKLVLKFRYRGSYDVTAKVKLKDGTTVIKKAVIEL